MSNVLCALCGKNCWILMPIAATLRCRLLNTARIKSSRCRRVPLSFRASVPLSGKHRRIVASVPSVGKHGRIAPLRMTVWRRQLGVVAVKPGCLAKMKLLYCCTLSCIELVLSSPQEMRVVPLRRSWLQAAPPRLLRRSILMCALCRETAGYCCAKAF